MIDLSGIVLGVVQGLTEFLPVSSSGHIAFFENSFGFNLESSLIFTVFLHLATLVLTVFYFKKAIIEVLSGLLKNEKTSWNIVLKGAIATLPAAFVGVFFKDTIDAMLQSSLAVSLGFVLTAATLFTAGYLVPKLSTKESKTGSLAEIDWAELSYIAAFIIGVCQAVAIMPGVSRSGMTICAALLLGLSVKTAFTFSFLISIPAISGATILVFKDFSSSMLSSGMSVELPLAFLITIITGYLALKLLEKYLKTWKFYRFGVYVLVISVLNLIINGF